MAKPTVQKASSSTKPMATDKRAIAFVSPTAMSVDVGERAMAAFKNSKELDAQISELTQSNQVKKYETLKSLTMSFVKAAQADKTIDLGKIHSDVDKEVSQLRQKLDVAIGIRTATRNEDGTDKLSLAPWTKDYLPQPGENKDTPGFQPKENFRTNFAAVFKKAILSAHAVVSKGLRIDEDKETGILLVSGKAIKERFNVDQIALNEKREIKEGDRTVKLAKVPSYTELGRISAESVGKAITTRAQSAAKLGGAKVTEKDIVEGVQSLQLAISKLTGFGDELATALEALQDTIERALSDNDGPEAA
jgi:hypothetical protein